MKSNIIIFLLIISCSFALQAQKYGHIDSQGLLLEMPEIKQADASLQAYQKQLVAKGEQMAKAFETSYNVLLEKVNNQELSPVQIQTEESKLATKQQEIQKYEQEVQQKMLAKRNELYQPIFTKVDDAIKAIGKEKGYTIVFDTSVGAIVFTNNADDLTAQVKARLGL